ncbi:hypothetical protein BB560_006503 [Smittium megazygosporum]|uniref:RNA helicase n=1 Tax=Smittium megazygosporum TaxID=133381 RepID=A0A2T9Y4T3_9FUNG|nr:hypothetical protein BB560_006503 [Smittium megazygosporum]
MFQLRSLIVKSRAPFVANLRVLPISTDIYFRATITRSRSSTAYKKQTPSNKKWKPSEFHIPNKFSTKDENAKYSYEAVSDFRDKLLYSLKDNEMYERAKFLSVPHSLYFSELQNFIKLASQDKIDSISIDTIRDSLTRGGEAEASLLTMPAYLHYLAKEFPDRMTKFLTTKSFVSTENVHLVYLNARAMRRKIIMHVGPTNSGKTYSALKRLEESFNGIYCSPLRLLAHEIYNKMLSIGRPCRLITGEDRREPDEHENLDEIPRDSKNNKINTILSCTIEMVNCSSLFEVGVIDEIQMIQDSQRGWAWTNALLGIRAKELHLCGEETAIPIVQKLLSLTGDSIEIRRYDRLNELTVEETGLDGDWSKVKEGDCVVTFSRKNIFKVAKEIELASGMKCALIYGQLPPENRIIQANLFNDPNSEYKVLVASDAIGMGINLKIKRIIFESVYKFDGRLERRLTLSQIKQISGRAGRYGISKVLGLVTTFNNSHLDTVKEALDMKAGAIQRAGIFPSGRQIYKLAHAFPNASFSQIVYSIIDTYSPSDLYFLSNTSHLIQLSKHLDQFKLPKSSYYTMMCAPINHRNDFVLKMAGYFANSINNSTPLDICEIIEVPKGSIRTFETLLLVESMHRSLILFIWLHYYYPSIFWNLEGALELKLSLENFIQSGMANHKSLKAIEKKRFM